MGSMSGRENTRHSRLRECTPLVHANEIHCSINFSNNQNVIKKR